MNNLSIPDASFFSQDHLLVAPPCGASGHHFQGRHGTVYGGEILQTSDCLSSGFVHFHGFIPIGVVASFHNLWRHRCGHIKTHNKTTKGQTS